LGSRGKRGVRSEKRETRAKNQESRSERWEARRPLRFFLTSKVFLVPRNKSQETRSERQEARGGRREIVTFEILNLSLAREPNSQRTKNQDSRSKKLEMRIN